MRYGLYISGYSYSSTVALKAHAAAMVCTVQHSVRLMSSMHALRSDMPRHGVMSVKDICLFGGVGLNCCVDGAVQACRGKLDNLHALSVPAIRLADVRHVRRRSKWAWCSDPSCFNS